jgi:hypothetical protein
MSLICTYFLTKSGELILRVDRERVLAELSSMSRIDYASEKQGWDAEKGGRLNDELLALEQLLENMFFDAPKKWHETQLFLFVILASVLLLTGLLALAYSHRMMAGSIYRITRSIVMLSEGIDVKAIGLRKHDEFEELVKSLNRLRMNLKAKGLLEAK